MIPAAPTLSSAPEDATLSDEQQAVIERALRGENLFITGNAGTGKSFLLHHLKDLLGPQLTAATGVAALQLKGETIHSWAGLGIGDKSAREIVAGLRNRAHQWGDRTLDRMQRTSMLVIDEVSMLSDDLIDLLDGVLSIARDSDEVFGGVQMLMVGDMLQLPPVSRDEEVGFAFEADAWKQANVGVAMLTKVFRQEEAHFSRILSKIRFDEVDDEVAAFLEERYHAEDPDPEYPACILHTHNSGCDIENNKMLAALPGPVTEKVAIDLGKHENFKKQLDRDCRAPAKLRLKVGARVMLLVNLDLPAGLANGSMGFVEAIGNSSITVRFDCGVTRLIERAMWEFKKAEEVVASREQFPLMLARAVTIHKCVSHDTRIPTNRGLLKISDIVENPEGVLVAGENGYHPIAGTYISGEELGYRITTNRGYSLLCSERHPLVVYREGGREWVKAPDLRVGDAIRMRLGTQAEGSDALPERTPEELHRNANDCRLPKTVTPEFAWWLGVLVGDGNYSVKRDGRVEIANSCPEVYERSVAFVQENLGIPVTLRNPSGSKVCHYFHNMRFRRFLETLGLGYVTARDKTVPEIIFNSSLACQASFVRGLCDTDGGANASVIHFTSASRAVIRDVQILLANLGIASSISAVGESQRVGVSGVDTITWCQKIGFTVPHKRAYAEVLRDRAAGLRTPKTDIGFLPGGKELLSEISGRLDRDSQGRLVAKYTEWRGYFSRVKSGKARLTDAHLRAFAEEHEVDHPAVASAVSGGFVDRIKSITRETAVMMDIEVPEGNAFIGNVFLNHNSQGMTLDKVEAHLAKCFSPGQSYVALSRARTSGGLFLRGPGVTISAHPKAVAFYKNHLNAV